MVREAVTNLYNFILKDTVLYLLQRFLRTVIVLCIGLFGDATCPQQDMGDRISFGEL